MNTNSNILASHQLMIILISSEMDSLNHSNNGELNNAERNTLLQKMSNQKQIKQEPLGDSIVTTSMDQFNPNYYPPLSANPRLIKREKDDDSELCPCPERVNIDTLIITNQTEGGDQVNSSDTSNEPDNDQSQMAGTNLSVEDGDESHPNGQMTQSKRKHVPPKDQSRRRKWKRTYEKRRSVTYKKTKHSNIKIIYLNCTELECTDQLKSIDDLRQHLTTKHGLLPYQCYARGCNRRWKNKQDVLPHLREHHSGPTEFVCPICGKEYASQIVAHTHLYTVHYTGKFECNIVPRCNQLGDTRMEIAEHLRQCFHHRANARFRVQCDQCLVWVANKRKLRTHYKRHTRFNQFRCTWPECDYQINLPYEIVYHIRKRHFGLPASVYQQSVMNIVDDRDAADFFVVVKERDTSPQSAQTRLLPIASTSAIVSDDGHRSTKEVSSVSPLNVSSPSVQPSNNIHIKREHFDDQANNGQQQQQMVKDVPSTNVTHNVPLNIKTESMDCDFVVVKKEANEADEDDYKFN